MKLALEGRLKHGEHAMHAWTVDTIHMRTGTAGNIKPDQQISTKKIDGGVATVMALVRAIRRADGYTRSSAYDQRGLLVL